ncbi:MAG: DUF5011 domain-containing protein [Bacteroidetes bacterium]|nr:DUF5011 domain-containing protein [Bacteroidota bacterium]
MKKNIIILSSALFLGATTLMIGCKKDDTTAPVVTLSGSDTQTLSLQGTYFELGATANDDEDGDLTSAISISNTINKDLTGTYTVTYSATDAAGNEGTATRTITVVNDAAKFEGTYAVTNLSFSPATWMQTIKASTTKNNRVIFSQFAQRTGNDKVSADLNGDFQVVAYTTGPLGTNNCTFNYATSSTSGTVPAKNASGKWTFKLTYTEGRGAAGDVGACSFVAPTPFVEDFVQN